jgi:hypothetical protein
MSDEVRAERSPDEWPDLSGDFRVHLGGGGSVGIGNGVWFGDESDADAFIAKVNGHKCKHEQMRVENVMGPFWWLACSACGQVVDVQVRPEPLT